MSKVDKKTVLEVLKSIKDPFIPVNLWDLGLIYDLDLDRDEEIQIEMTLVSENNPKREKLVEDLKLALEKQFPTQKINITLVFQPAWTPERMNDEAKKKLGIEDA